MAKRKSLNSVNTLSPENYIRKRSSNLPIHECIISKEWEDAGLANILISRKHSNGNFTVALYLVDINCLGIKDTHFMFNISAYEYQDMKEGYAFDDDDFEYVDYTLVHNIIYAAWEFAADYGFEPCKDFRMTTKYFLAEDDDAIELMEIACGKDDKPFFIRGEFDSDSEVERILSTLERTAGAGNYDFIIGDYNKQDLQGLENEYDDWSVSDKLALFKETTSHTPENITPEILDRTALLVASLTDDLLDDNELFDNEYDDLFTWDKNLEVIDEIPSEYLGKAAAHEAEIRELFVKADNAHSGNYDEVIEKLRNFDPNCAFIKYLEVTSYKEKDGPRYLIEIEKLADDFPEFQLFRLELINYNTTARDQVKPYNGFLDYLDKIEIGNKLWSFEYHSILVSWAMLCVLQPRIEYLYAMESFTHEIDFPLVDIEELYLGIKLKFFSQATAEDIVMV